MSGSAIARTYQQTVSHYINLREAVYEFSENEFRALSLKFTGITYRDAAEADSWYWNEDKKNPSWQWTRMYKDYQSHAGVKRFEVAVRAHGKLCALCYGVPSRKKLILKLHALSRNPNNNPLQGKILSTVLFTADAYARLIGSEEMWLCNPMNRRLVNVYENVGFTAHYDKLGKATHLSMRLQS